MSDNYIEDDVLEALKPIRIKNSIKKPPSYNLRACLSFLTKHQLVDIAYEHGKHVSMSNKKDVIIKILEKILISRIGNDSLYFTAGERDMLVEFIETDGIADDILEGTIKLNSLGYVYWFYHDAHFYAVCPVEIAKEFMKYYKTNYEHIVKRNNEILNYINALQHIYGVFEVEQLLLVWNKYNKDKLDLVEAYDFLNIVGRRQNYFWCDPPYIISDYFMEYEEYENYLRSRSKVDYYMPTKKELNYYMENEFDEENIYYKKIMKFLERSEDLDLRAIENISVSIEVVSTIDGSLQEIVNEMNEEGFDFDSFDEVNEFAQLFINLSNTTRKWSIKGYKPDELVRENSNSMKRDKENTVIPFERPFVSKKKKIGRNEPCPCGSGKKYKFCCGK